MPKRFSPLSAQPIASSVAAGSPVCRDFYLDTPDLVAQKLLGKLLVRAGAGAQQERVARIVEVEAYFGEADPAAHSFRGQTARNAVLFGPPGYAYVYFVYGMHYCLNVSCQQEGGSGCVLFRALEPLRGFEPPATLTAQRSLTSGPGRLCKALGITRERDNGADLTSPHSDLRIEQDGFVAGEVLVTPRIGISKAADRPARFLLAHNPFVSGVKRANFAR